MRKNERQSSAAAALMLSSLTFSEREIFLRGGFELVTRWVES